MRLVTHEKKSNDILRNQETNQVKYPNNVTEINDNQTQAIQVRSFLPHLLNPETEKTENRIIPLKRLDVELITDVLHVRVCSLHHYQGRLFLVTPHIPVSSVYPLLLFVDFAFVPRAVSGIEQETGLDASLDDYGLLSLRQSAFYHLGSYLGP